MSQEIDSCQPDGVDEGLGVAGCLLDRVWSRSGGGSNSSVVEEDDLTIGGQCVGNRRVVVVEVAHEVLKEDDRHSTFGSESTMRESSALDLDEFGRGCVVCVSGHGGLS
jgi:hypothetical protein